MANQFLSPIGDLEEYFVTESWLIDQYVGDIVWGWGLNNRGQLGNNTTTASSTPVTFTTGGNNWKQISSGGYAGSLPFILESTFVAAVRTGGALWLWGTGSRLGTNDTSDRLTPVTTFLGGTDWIQVACGVGHGGAVKNNGTLWMWGDGSNGKLGTNDTTNRLTPTQIVGNTWTQVSCGYQFTAGIKNDGTLWMWGANDAGQLGTNNLITRSTPVTTFAGGNNWKKVSCGQRTIAAIKTDGTLWTWGLNIGSTPVNRGGNNWKKVSIKNNHFAAIKVDGSLWLWGDNTNGQLGTNDTTGRGSPVTTFLGGNNWKEVACGFVHTAAIKTDGTLWTWGSNLYAQLGRQGGGTVSIPTIVSTSGNMRGNSWKTVDCTATNTYAITSGIPVDLS